MQELARVFASRPICSSGTAETTYFYALFAHSPHVRGPADCRETGQPIAVLTLGRSHRVRHSIPHYIAATGSLRLSERRNVYALAIQSRCWVKATTLQRIGAMNASL